MSVIGRPAPGAPSRPQLCSGYDQIVAQVLIKALLKSALYIRDWDPDQPFDPRAVLATVISSSVAARISSLSKAVSR